MRCWKVLSTNRTSLISGTGYQYPPKAWTGHLDPDSLALCERGYHYCEGPQVLEWLREGLLAEVEPCPKHEPLRADDKMVSCRLRIVRTFPLTARVLRLFAADCAERALLAERERGREPHADSWRAIAVARRFADGEATGEELAAAAAAAYAAYAYAAYASSAADAAANAAAAAYRAAADAAYYAAANAYAAAYDAARRAERDWQYHRLLELAGA